MSKHGFTQIDEHYLAELNSLAKHLRHDATGAELLSLENDDDNKCFGATFHTPVADSTGVAHILEHCVLAGSRKYPLKDPFAELVKSSLATFLNALTWPDKTCYPVASQNQKDFYNLVDVYLDTIFYPLLRPETFLQQGWHFELDNDATSLSYKGVVFNEMKGVYSSPESILGRSIQHSLFPDTSYGLDSGGNPTDIPNLTYDAFVDFHKKYYHPSNGFFFFYGNDNLDYRLELLNSWFKDFAAIPRPPHQPLQPPFSTPRSVQKFYPASVLSKAMATTNWLWPEQTNSTQDIALRILSHILIGTNASPLRKALLDSHLGENLAGGGLSSSLRQAYFSIGLKGVQPDNVTQVEPLIFATLEALYRDGIDRGTIEASLNSIEFYLRENNHGSFPRGLAMMFRALTTWLHGHNPLIALRVIEQLTQVKRLDAINNHYFGDLIKQYLLDNNNRTSVTLLPDTALLKLQEEIERDKLDLIRASLSENKLASITADCARLKSYQETPDSPEVIATIPGLKLEEIDRTNKFIPMEEISLNGAKVLFHDLPTGGIVYADLVFSILSLPPRLVGYLPIFTRALTDVGTNKETYVQLSQRIGRVTGGVHAYSTHGLSQDTRELGAWVVIRGKSTVDKAKELFDILTDILLDVCLDNRERMKQIVLQEKASAEAKIIPSGNSIVMTRLASRLNPSAWVSEQTGGINYLFFIRELAARFDSEWESILADLEAVRAGISGPPILNLTVDQASFNTIHPIVQELLDRVPNAPLPPQQWTPDLTDINEGLVAPAAVNYVGKGADLYQLGFAPHGSALVISQYLTTTWLWEKVRVQGGAYGGSCSFNHRSGVFGFSSYRDPNLEETLKVYDETADFLRATKLTEHDLTRSIIGTIRGLDAYRLPDAQGYLSMMRYLLGETEAHRQQLRDEILTTQPRHFQEFVHYLDLVKTQGRTVVLAEPETVARAEKGLGLLVTKVL